MPKPPPRHRIALTGPEMPADYGLSGLGLLMQLGGSIYLGLMSLTMLATVVVAGPGRGGGMVMLIALTGFFRSALHRAAGSALLYGPADEADVGNPLRLTRLYVIASAIQTVAVLGMVDIELDPGRGALFGLALVLLAWPATLMVVLRAPRFRRITTAIPMPEDRGFTGVSIYMTLFGLTGAVFAACALVVEVRLPGSSLLSGRWLALAALFALLVYRSIQHARAGLAGVNGEPVADFLVAAARYTKIGIASAVVACCVLGMFAFETRSRALFVLQAMFVGYTLALWPLLVRRFFAERGYSAFLHRGMEAFAPAPDRGLTALGWLLLALGVLGLADALPTVLLGADQRLVSGLIGANPMSLDLAQAAGRSPWWSVLLSAAQVWAALELVAMTSRHRLAGAVYGGGGALITLYLSMPLIEAMFRDLGRVLGGGVAGLLVFAQLAIALVIPIATLLLITRSRGGLAQARVVHSDRPDPGSPVE